MIPKNISFIAILSLSTTVFAQQNTQNTTQWRNEIRKMYSSERKFIFDMFRTAQSWQITYASSIEVYSERAKGYVTYNTEGQLIAAANYRIRKTKNEEAYADEHDMINLDKNAKKITRVATIPLELKMADETYSQATIDTILKTMNIISRSCENINGKIIASYNFVSQAKDSRYKYASIFIDTANAALYKIRVEMDIKQQKAVRAFTFKVVERKIMKYNPAYSHVYDLFFEPNGALKEKYSRYKLVDLTKK